MRNTIWNIVSSRVKSTLEEQWKPDLSPIKWLFKVFYESLELEISGFPAHAIRECIDEAKPLK